MIDLKTMRDEWYRAYYCADIDQLNYIEHENFHVVTAEKVVSKERQLRNIKQFYNVGKWFSPNIKRQEDNLITVDLGSVKVLYGDGELIENGKKIQRGKFCETWVLDENRWKVTSLSYNDVLL